MSTNLTPIQIFTSKIRVADSGCWEWQAHRGRGGYGQFHSNRHPVAAHRWSYEHHVGPVPQGLELDHLCRNRACVNPEHLEPVTKAENQRRSTSPSGMNAAKTHCDHGHALSGDNLTVAVTGKRLCKACRREISARSRRKRGTRS